MFISVLQHKMAIVVSVCLICVLVFGDTLINITTVATKPARILDSPSFFQQSDTPNKPEYLSAANKILALSGIKDDEPVEQSDELTAGLRLSEQDTQTGLVHALFIDNFRYVLTAIVDDSAFAVQNTNRVVAILSRFNYEDKSTDVVQLNLGDNLSKYLVEKIDSRRVLLVQNNRQIELKLFWPIN